MFVNREVLDCSAREGIRGCNWHAIYSQEHKDLICKNALECDSSHKQSQSLEKNDEFKKEYHSWVKDKNSREETQKVTFFPNKYYVFREEQ